jgi:hypothetical protein
MAYTPNPANAPGTPGGRNQLALVSFLLSLIFPVGVALNAFTILFLRVTTSAAVAGLIQVASGVIGLAGFAGFISAIVTGHIALSRAKRYPPGQAMRGLAITGLVIGYLSLVVLVGYIGLFITLLLQNPP